MKIHYMSDLHLEQGRSPKLKNIPSGDVLLLAGDIISTKALKLSQSRRDTADELFAEFKKNFLDVYVIMGNHEHYGGDFLESYARFEELYKKHRFVFLENDCEPFADGWRIWGGTLWTDYNNGEFIPMHAANDCMMDHAVVSYGPDELFTPQRALEANKRAIITLRASLKEYRNDKFVVMSHHTPSMKCGHEKWGGAHNVINYAFHNNGLDNLIGYSDQIKYWVAGHTHDPIDTKIGDCRVMINPHGYSGPEDNNGFDVNANFVLEV